MFGCALSSKENPMQPNPHRDYHRRYLNDALYGHPCMCLPLVVALNRLKPLDKMGSSKKNWYSLKPVQIFQILIVFQAFIAIMENNYCNQPHQGICLVRN